MTANYTALAAHWVDAAAKRQARQKNQVPSSLSAGSGHRTHVSTAASSEDKEPIILTKVANVKLCLELGFDRRIGSNLKQTPFPAS
eukprot:5786553-Amphidinium_carterae.1